MSDLPQLDVKMSDAEGLMWRLEKDPHLSSTFASVMVLDRKPDVERLTRRLERATLAFARLRQRVQPVPANLSAPLWVDDPNFDIRYHVRHIALPKPGSMRQLEELTSLVAMDPFDRTRPLWQFTVVDGLKGGRAALISKLHHTIADGEMSIRLSLEYLDFERDAPEPPPIAAPADDPAAATTSSQHDLVRDLFAGSMKLPLGIVRQVRDLLADPAGLPGAGSAAADTVRGILSQLSEVDKARSPLWTQRSLQRTLETLRVPFEDVRDAGRRLGGTLNNALLTAAAEAAGRYHDQLGAPVDELRASMAVSTRTETSGTNAFSLARILVPTGTMPIEERFGRIQAATAAARSSTPSTSLDALASLAATLPTSVITRLARQQAQTVDFATSNVKGSPVPMFVSGAQVMAIYPVGPLAGVAFNLTLLSYDHGLDVGMNVDRVAVAEPDLLRSCLETAFRDLAAT